MRTVLFALVLAAVAGMAVAPASACEIVPVTDWSRSAGAPDGSSFLLTQVYNDPPADLDFKTPGLPATDDNNFGGVGFGALSTATVFAASPADVSAAATPEPASLLLIGPALFAFALRRRKR